MSRRALVEARLEPGNDRCDIAMKLAGPFERVEQLSVIDRPAAQPASRFALNVLADELPEQLTDRNGSGSLPELRPGLIVDVNACHVIALKRAVAVASRRRRRSRTNSGLVATAASHRHRVPIEPAEKAVVRRAGTVYAYTVHQWCKCMTASAVPFPGASRVAYRAELGLAGDGASLPSSGERSFWRGRGHGGRYVAALGEHQWSRDGPRGGRWSGEAAATTSEWIWLLLVLVLAGQRYCS